MAIKSAPIIAPRTKGPVTTTFSLVTSMMGTDLNLALPVISIAFFLRKWFYDKIWVFNALALPVCSSLTFSERLALKVVLL